MWVTELGIEFFKGVITVGALLKGPFLATDKFAKELQSRKAHCPMWVTESGMVKLTKELQF